MTIRTLKLYPSAPLENNVLERRLEKNFNFVNSFSNSLKDVKGMILCFKDKIQKPKKKY